MKVSDVLVHRRAVLRQLWQKLLVLAMLGGVTVVLLGTEWQAVWKTLACLLWCIVCVLLLVRSEFKAMWSFHLQLLPPGGGTLRPGTHATGRFISFSELSSRFRWQEGGIRVGRPLPEHRLFGVGRDLIVGPKDDRHMLTIAGGRSGKGTAAVIPNLLTYPGSVLVIDPKGELAQITSARRGTGSARVVKSLGQDVHVFDPEGITAGLPVSCWNPLAELDLNHPALWTHVSRLAGYLIPPQPTKQADEFFLNHARDLLTALILHVLTTEEPPLHTLPYVRKLILQGDRELFQYLQDECSLAGTPLPVPDAFGAVLLYMADSTLFGGKLSGIAQGILSMADVTQSGVLGTLREQTSFLDDPGIEQALSRSDFLLSDLKTKPTSIYLCMKGTSFATNLVRVLYVFLELAIFKIEAIPGRPPHNVLFIMDEFYTMGRSEAIDRAIGLIAGYGLTLWPILQHIGQLKTHYPQTWDNFIRNCRAVQYFGDQEPESLQELEKRIGYLPKGWRSSQPRPLLSYYDLSSSYFSRDCNRQIVLFQQQPAAALELTHYYNSFPNSMYEEDPRSAQRSTYAGWYTDGTSAP